MGNKGFKFVSWLAVIHYCEIHAWVYYKAPMDLSSTVVAVRRVFKNGKIRLTPPSGHSFTADRAHLDRFSYPD
jgi:hypothetical protein